MNPGTMRKLRKDKGLSLKQLAEKTEISFSAIGMYERGEAEPSSEKFQKIAEVLGVSMEELLGKTTMPTGDLNSEALEEISKNKAIDIISKQQDNIAFQQELLKNTIKTYKGNNHRYQNNYKQYPGNSGVFLSQKMDSYPQCHCYGSTRTQQSTQLQDHIIYLDRIATSCNLVHIDV